MIRTPLFDQCRPSRSSPSSRLSPWAVVGVSGIFPQMPRRSPSRGSGSGQRQPPPGTGLVTPNLAATPLSLLSRSNSGLEETPLHGTDLSTQYLSSPSPSPDVSHSARGRGFTFAEHEVYEADEADDGTLPPTLSASIAILASVPPTPEPEMQPPPNLVAGANATGLRTPHASLATPNAESPTLSSPNKTGTQARTRTLRRHGSCTSRVSGNSNVSKQSGCVPSLLSDNPHGDHNDEARSVSAFRDGTSTCPEVGPLPEAINWLKDANNQLEPPSPILEGQGAAVGCRQLMLLIAERLIATLPADFQNRMIYYATKNAGHGKPDVITLCTPCAGLETPVFTLGNLFKSISQRKDAPAMEDMRNLQLVWGVEIDDALRNNNIECDDVEDESDLSGIFFPKPLQYFKDSGFVCNANRPMLHARWYAVSCAIPNPHERATSYVYVCAVDIVDCVVS